MRLSGIAAVLYLLVWVACIVGWVINCVAIANTYMLDITGMFILRIVGIFIFPLGAVLGIFF